MPSLKPLHCIVCGYERGGTTLISELIRQHPNIDGRFEGGLLLADTISGFRFLEPYASNLRRFWGLSEQDLDYLCEASNWNEAYARLIERSNIPSKHVSLYDKTPGYMAYLSDVLGKVDVPCICVVRDPRALYWSHLKHEMDVEESGFDNPSPFLIKIENIRKRIKQSISRKKIRHWGMNYYNRYAESLQMAQNKFPGRILVIRLEQLCVDPIHESRRIYDFLGLRFLDEYIKLPYTENPYVARGGIVREVIDEYETKLTKSEQALLLKYTQECSDWHWLD